MTKRLDKHTKAALGRSRKPILTKARLEEHLHMTCATAAEHLGVGKTYLRKLAHKWGIQFPREWDLPPPILDRRCPCGAIFQCHDIRKERVCPACEEAMAA